LISIAHREKMGIILVKPHTKKGFGAEKTINLWLRGGSPNRNLSILTALQLERNWNGRLRLLRVVKDPSEQKKAEVGLRRVAERGRLPVDVERIIYIGNFSEQLALCPKADLNIFGMSQDLDIDQMHELCQRADTACLFVMDSGEESALV
jgi:hypothetical protein